MATSTVPRLASVTARDGVDTRKKDNCGTAAAVNQETTSVGVAHVQGGQLAAYYIPDRTCPRHALKANGEPSKSYEYAQMEGVPCRLVSRSDILVNLHSFVSDMSTVFQISSDEFQEQFVRAEVVDGFILVSKYPGGRIHVSEFDKRNEATELIHKATKVIGDKSLEDKLRQLLQTQGSTHAATVPVYLDFKNGKRILKPTENLGDAVFNRSKRWCPPVNIDHDAFKQTIGFPAPIGIRPKDFCLPSELAQAVTVLLVQMAQFENSPAAFVAFVSNIPEVSIPGDIHLCKWCAQPVDAKKCTTKYKSETNYIEICHRDPNQGFSVKNMYWGHGDCNRRQGGYTELDRIDDVVSLIDMNPEYREILLRKLGL
jgi:hypothetical protein